MRYPRSGGLRISGKDVSALSFCERAFGRMGGIRGRMRSILSSSVYPAPEAHASLLLLLRALLHPMRFKCARRYIEAFPPLRNQLSVSSALERSLWPSLLRGGVHDNYLAVVLSVYVHGERSHFRLSQSMCKNAA